MSGKSEKTYSYEQFLSQEDRVNEKFFVIDNTDYPEALRDSSWNWQIKKEIAPDPEHDVYV